MWINAVASLRQCKSILWPINSLVVKYINEIDQKALSAAMRWFIDLYYCIALHGRNWKTPVAWIMWHPSLLLYVYTLCIIYLSKNNKRTVEVQNSQSFGCIFNLFAYMFNKFHWNFMRLEWLQGASHWHTPYNLLIRFSVLLMLSHESELFWKNNVLLYIVWYVVWYMYYVLCTYCTSTHGLYSSSSIYCKYIYHTQY